MNPMAGMQAGGGMNMPGGQASGEMGMMNMMGDMSMMDQMMGGMTAGGGMMNRAPQSSLPGFPGAFLRSPAGDLWRSLATFEHRYPVADAPGSPAVGFSARFAFSAFSVGSRMSQTRPSRNWQSLHRPINPISRRSRIKFARSRSWGLTSASHSSRLSAKRQNFSPTTSAKFSPDLRRLRPRRRRLQL